MNQSSFLGKLFRLLSLLIFAFVVVVMYAFVHTTFIEKADKGAAPIDVSSSYITFGEGRLDYTDAGYFGPEKQTASNLVGEGKYDEALSILGDYLSEIEPNDPEARIFHSNIDISARNRGSFSIAVPLPLEENPKKSLEVLRGVAQAQYEFNSTRASNQLLLRVGIADDSGRVEEVAREIFENPDFLGVVGHYSSKSSSDALMVYGEELVSISPISTAVDLAQKSSYFFRTVPNDKVAAVALARYAKNKQEASPKAIVIYNSDSDYSESLRDEFIKEIGKNNILLENESLTDLTKWPSGVGDWESSATELYERAGETAAEYIMLAPSSKHLEKTIELVKLNREFTLLGGDAVYSNEVTLNKGGSSAIGTVVAVAWDIEINDLNSDFPRRAGELWGTSNVSWRTICAYDATQAFAHAVDKQPSPTRKGTQQELAAGNFRAPGAFKQVRFQDSGDYFGDVQLVRIEAPSGYPDFIPINP